MIRELPGIGLRRRQRGAAAIFVALGIVALVSAAALAIDLGRIYFAERELQRLANGAALDIMTGASGCGERETDRLELATTLARSSIDRNGGEGRWLEQGGSLRLGRATADGALWRFAPVDDPNRAVAVEVGLARPFPARLFALPGVDPRAPMRAVASARRAPLVSLSVNSAVAGISPEAVPFYNQLFGGPGAPLALGAGALQAAAEAALSITPESVNEIFGADFTPGQPGPPIPTPNMLDAIVNQLFDDAQAGADEMQAIVCCSDGLNDQIPGNIITVPPEYDQVGGATAPAFDVVRTVIAAGRPDLGFLPPGPPGPGNPTDPSLMLRIQQPARTVLGPAVDDGGDLAYEARSAQVVLGFSGGVPMPLGDMRLALEMEVAPSTARVRQIRCASRDRDVDGVEIAVQTGAATLRLGDGQPLLRFTDDLSLPIVGLVPVDIEIFADSDVQAVDPTRRILDFDGPFGDPQRRDLSGARTQAVGGSATRGLDNAMYSLVDGLQLEIRGTPALPGVPAGALAALLQNELRQNYAPVIRTALTAVLLDLDDRVLLPALEAVGVRLPSTEVTVFEVKVPRPVLFGPTS